MSSMWGSLNNAMGSIADLKKNLDDAAGLQPRQETEEVHHEVVVRATTPVVTPPMPPPPEAVVSTEVDEAEFDPPVVFPSHPPSRILQLEAEGTSLAQQLGKEKDRVRTLLAEKRSLEAELSSAATRDRQWADSRSLMEASEVAMRATVDRLRGRVEELETELLQSRKEHGAGSSQRQDLQDEIERLTSSQMAVQRDGEWETRRLRDELRKVLSDTDKRMSGLQQELSGSQSRCHAAEMKCVDLLRAVSDATCPLHDQITQYEGMIAPLQETLKTTRREVRELKEQNGQAAALHGVLQASLLEAHGEVLKLHSEIEGLRRDQRLVSEGHAAERDHQSGMLSQKSKALQEALQALHSEREAYRASLANSVVNNNNNNNVQTQPEEVVAAPLHLPVAAVPPMSFHPEGVLRAKVTHLERELLRMMNENSSARAVMSEFEKLRGKYIDLQGQHDVLLQMYGELSEKQ